MSEEDRLDPGTRKIDLKPLLEREAAEEPSNPPRHKSLEKTDPYLERLPEDFEAPGAGPAVAEPVPRQELRQPGDMSDIELLKEELAGKARECSKLTHEVDELKRQLETTRSDYSGQANDRLLEIRTLRDLLQRNQSDASRLTGEVSELKQIQKELKAQNLALQYQLNSWGLPVIASEDGRSEEERKASEPAAFFPGLTPMPGGPDPVPVILRGDLSSFYFPNLLHFLANANLSGVVTVVTDGIVSKLYLEKAILLLAGWNNRDKDLSLATLLRESGLVAALILDEVEGEDLYDLELASILVSMKHVPPAMIQSGLKEHARVILSFLFGLKRGGFFFQAGQIPRKRELQFRLAVTDVLLKTAAEMDEKTRDMGDLTRVGIVSA